MSETETASRAARETAPAGETAPACSCGVVHEERVREAIAAAPGPGTLQDLGELFRLFADPTRLGILSALSGGELCVCDLTLVLGMSQSAVSHQLALLRTARLVKNRREGKTVFYSLDDEHVREILLVGLSHLSERKEAR